MPHLNTPIKWSNGYNFMSFIKAGKLSTDNHKIELLENGKLLGIDKIINRK